VITAIRRRYHVRATTLISSLLRYGGSRRLTRQMRQRISHFGNRLLFCAGTDEYSCVVPIRFLVTMLDDPCSSTMSARGVAILRRLLIVVIALSVAVTLVFNSFAHLNGGPPRYADRRVIPPIAAAAYPATCC
jgi:hypothetical protein